VKIPFVGLFKIFLFLLNLIPTPVKVVYAKVAYSQTAGLSQVGYETRPGAASVHFGVLFIAYSRGAVFPATLVDGSKRYCIKSHVYDDVINKWAL